MKKILALLLALIMVVGVFASCNSSNNSTPDSDPTDAPSTNEDTKAEGDKKDDTTADENKNQESNDPNENNNQNNNQNNNNQNNNQGGNTNDEKYDVITIAKALELRGEPGNITEERYYIRGIIVSVDNAQYGAMTVKDDTGEISVYGTYSSDGSINYSAMTDKPYKGDEVLLHCILQNYKGTKEVKNARLIEFKKNETTVNEADYTDMSVADARAAATGTKIKLDGVVATITYANGKIPVGVYVVDNTQSIYVYDSDIAQRVEIGNKITVLGSKAYWILDSEKNNAQKFGYNGCCQLEDATLVSNDEKQNNVDYSWVSESTVKDVLDTPVTENITSSIVKVNALVKKVPGNGFVNYYFYDLDGKTGSYTYTQCNGSDFAWLDKFDGKICTVYLSALNAKSTAADCYFRFIPVSVLDETFVFDLNGTAEHVVKYYGVGQFNASYTGDPAKELETTFSSELLGFTNATLTFTSSNEDVIYVTTDGAKTVFHCGETGTAKLTVSCTYNGKTYSEDVEITVAANASYHTITVESAKAKDEGEEVIVEGIVGPSLINQVGFYLFDETGMISVRVDASAFDDLEIGNKIVVKGTRLNARSSTGTNPGQICITDGQILANYYGDHDYRTFDAITDKDVEYLYNLDVDDQHTDELYVITAKIIYDTSNSYSHQYKIESNGTKLSLYCSGAKQYSDLLEQFKDKEVTIELAPCNWNSKKYYAFCILSVTTADGTVYNEYCFNN